MNTLPLPCSRAFSAFLLIFSSIFLHAQPALRWDATIGWGDYEELNALLPMPDGSLVVGGSTKSNGDFGHPADLSWNMIVVKLDPARHVEWQRVFPTNADDRLWEMLATPDGGFLLGGYSYAHAGGAKTDTSRGDMDFWVLKLAPDGQKTWDKTFGGSGRDELFGLVAMPDGGFLLCGNSTSGRTGDKTSDSRGDQDFWLVRTDQHGNFLWDKTIGGSGREQLLDATLAPDGAVLLAGASNSPGNSGDLSTDFARGGMDFLLAKIDPASGQIHWNHRYGGADEDVAYALVAARNGGYFLGGFSRSEPALPTSSNNGKTAEQRGGGGDFWLVKTDVDGHKLADWGFGGAGFDGLKALHEDWLGNLFLLGDSDSGISGDKNTAGHGGTDFWLIVLDSLGNRRWEATLGGAGADAPTKIAACPKGGFLLGGHSDSGVGFEKTNSSRGKNDLWALSFCCDLTTKIHALGNSQPCSGEPLMLEAEAANCPDCAWVWNTGATAPQIEIAPGTADTFRLVATASDGCVARDSMFAEASEPPALNLGARDTTIFEHETIVIGSDNPLWAHLWNTGDTSATLTVGEAGLYALTVTDANGCTARDWLRVALAAKSHVWVPNAFSPDLDGVNEFLTVYASPAVREVRAFQVLDRWGNMLFQREHFAPNYDPDGWNGYIRGRTPTPGLHTWRAVVEYLDGATEQFTGTVFLKI